MDSIIDTLVARDNISREDAESQVAEARERVMNGADPEEILYEDFGLEPDYIFDLIF